MAFATARMSGFIVVAALTLPAITAGGVIAIVGDPHRWSKPDVYIGIAATAYAVGIVAFYPMSPAFRRYCTTRMTGWRGVLFNPYILLVMSANWARYHDLVFPVLMLALIGWLMWRQPKARAESLRAPPGEHEADASISRREPRSP